MTTHKLSTDDLLELSVKLIKLVETDYSSHWVLPKKFVELFDEDYQATAKLFYDKVATSYKNIQDLTTLSIAQADWHRQTFTFTENAIVYNTALYIYKETRNRKPIQLLHDWSRGSYGKRGRFLATAINLLAIVYIFVVAPWIYSFTDSGSFTASVTFVVLWLLPILLVIMFNSVARIPRAITL